MTKLKVFSAVFCLKRGCFCSVPVNIFQTLQFALFYHTKGVVIRVQTSQAEQLNSFAEVDHCYPVDILNSFLLRGSWQICWNIKIFEMAGCLQSEIFATFKAGNLLFGKLSNFEFPNYHYYNHFTTLCLGLPRWVSTRRINHSEFCWSRHDGVAVASAEPYASYLHFAAEDYHARRYLISQIFMGRMPFLTPNQQHQSTEGLVWRLRGR